MAMANSVINRPQPTGLYDILDLILDKGLVIDAFVRVSVVGIEILTIDARIVIASVDTYLRFAEAANRLDLTQSGGVGLPDLAENLEQSGAEGKTKGALSGAAESASKVVRSRRGGDDEQRAPRRRPAQAASRQRSRSADNDESNEQ